MDSYIFKSGLRTYLIYIVLILAAIALNTIAKKILKERWNLWLGYAAPALFMVVFLWNVTNFFGRLFIDFNKAYYPAGYLVFQNPVMLYDQPKGDLTFVNLPIFAFLFVPFSLLPKLPAGLLMLLLGIIASLAASYFLLKLTNVSGWRKFALVGLFVINGPLYYSLKWGNTTHFVLLLLIGAIFLIQKRRDVWVGVLLAIAGLIKIPLLLFGAYFALRGRWRVVLGFGISLLVIVGTSVLLFGIDLHLLWFEKCIQPFMGKPVSAYNVQSVDGFLARLLIKPDLYNWLPLEVGSYFKIVKYVMLSLLIGGVIFVFWRKKSPPTLEVEYLEFSIVLCLALVIASISWTHYYSFLLLPLSLYLGDKLAVPRGRLWFGLMVLGTFLISQPVVFVQPLNPFWKSLMFRVLISHYFFGGILLLGVLLAARSHTAKSSQLSAG